MEIAGAKVPLQRVSISLPPDVHDVGGLTFVLRRCGWRGEGREGGPREECRAGVGGGWGRHGASLWCWWEKEEGQPL